MSQSNVIEVISPDGTRKEIPLQKSIVFIGSDPHVDVPLAASPGIASRHLQLIAVPDAGCRLVNLGDTEVLLGAAGERGLAPHFSTEVADGESIKIGKYVLLFRSAARSADNSPVEANTSGQSRHIGLSLTLPQTRLAPHRTLEGIVTVSNLGDIAGVQFELELEGFEPDCYELEPGPLLSSGAEKEVLFRLYHRGAKPLAGDYQLTIYATAPRAYPAEQGRVSQVIQVQPFYQHTLTIVSPTGAKPATTQLSPSAPTKPIQPTVTQAPPLIPEAVQAAAVEPSPPVASVSVQPTAVEPLPSLPPAPTVPPPKPSGWWSRFFGPRQTTPAAEPELEIQVAAPVELEPLPSAEAAEEIVEAEQPSTMAEEPTEVVDAHSRLLADMEPTPPVPEIEIPEPALPDETEIITTPELAPVEALPPVEEMTPPDEVQQPVPAEAEAPLPPVEVQRPESARTEIPLPAAPKLASPATQTDDWWTSPMESAPRFGRAEQTQKKNEPTPETSQAVPTEQVSKKQADPASTAASAPQAEDGWTIPAATEQTQRRALKVKATRASETETTQPAAAKPKAEDWWTSQDTEDDEDKIED